MRSRISWPRRLSGAAIAAFISVWCWPAVALASLAGAGAGCAEGIGVTSVLDVIPIFGEVSNGIACLVGGAIGAVAPGVTEFPFKVIGSSFIDQIANAIQTALLSVLKDIATFWVKLPTFTVASGSTPTDPVQFIYNHIAWYIGAFALLSVIIGVIRMMWDQQPGGAVKILKGVVIFIMIWALSLTVIELLITASDDFASWILAQSMHVTDSPTSINDAFGKGLTSMLVLNGTANGGAFLVIILGFLALIGSIVQMILMVFRNFMLVLMVGMLPLSYTLWTTKMGRQWAEKSTSWLLSLVLYKPTAALVFATALQMVAYGGKSGSLTMVITGFAGLAGSIVLLPALMRLIVPMTGAVASGGASMVLGGAEAVGMFALPTGAAALSAVTGGRMNTFGLGGGQGGAGGGNPSGASGSGGSFTSRMSDTASSFATGAHRQTPMQRMASAADAVGNESTGANTEEPA
jgi:type IV secretion system protein TrbL